MSLFSKWIDRQVSKRGKAGAILWFAGMVAKVTPSKKDDDMIAKIKKILEEEKK